MNQKMNVDFMTIDSCVDDLNIRIKSIHDIFSRIDTNMTRFREEKTWQGSTADSVFEKYDDLQKSYEPIVTSLKHFVGLIHSARIAYSDVDTTASSKVEDEDLEM